MEVSSKLNESLFTVGQRWGAIRFILAMPMDEMFHVRSLPEITYEYIFKIGHLVDIPWVQFNDDDTGSRIARAHRHLPYFEMRELILGSRLIKRVKSLEWVIQEFYYNRITVDDFEIHIYRYAQRQAFNSKSIL